MERITIMRPKESIREKNTSTLEDLSLIDFEKRINQLARSEIRTVIVHL